VAPVNDPRTCAKSWFSSNVSTITEQLQIPSFGWLTGLMLWIARATSSFPVPVDPTSSTFV
jgi:hypothetical protein